MLCSGHVAQMLQSAIRYYGARNGASQGGVFRIPPLFWQAWRLIGEPALEHNLKLAPDAAPVAERQRPFF
jgi:hypothetical protein